MKTIAWGLLLTTILLSGCTTNKCVYFKLYDADSALTVVLPEAGYAPFSVDGGEFEVNGRVGYMSMPIGATEAERTFIRETCANNAPAFFQLQ